MDAAYKKLGIAAVIIMIIGCGVVFGYSFVRGTVPLTKPLNPNQVDFSGAFGVQPTSAQNDAEHVENSELSSEQVSIMDEPVDEQLENIEQSGEMSDEAVREISDAMSVEAVVEDVDISENVSDEAPGSSDVDEHGFVRSGAALSGYVDVGQLRLYYVSGRKDTHPAVELMVRSQPSVLPEKVRVIVCAKEDNSLTQTIEVPISELMSQECMVVTFDGLQDETICDVTIDDGINVEEFLSEV